MGILQTSALILPFTGIVKFLAFLGIVAAVMGLTHFLLERWKPIRSTVQIVVGLVFLGWGFLEFRSAAAPLFEYLRNDGLLIKPQLMLMMFGIGILLTDFLMEPGLKYFNAIMAMAGVLFSGITLWQVSQKVGVAGDQFGFPSGDPRTASMVVDHFSLFFGMVFLAAAALTILLSVRYMEIEQENHGEFYALILFATIGMMFMAEGFDLITLFIGLETMALSFYVLVGFLRRERRSNEAALKYLLLGAFSSGILVYGFSLLYGISFVAGVRGSTNLVDITNAMIRSNPTSPIVLLALVTVAAGLFFKIAAVPFHQWAPDVYEGAPTVITAYLSVASTAASFALLLRLFQTVFWPVRDHWTGLLGVVAVASMTVGNLAAITQTNIKRMLAYSSISHAGYILLGLVAAGTGLEPNEKGLTGISVYIFGYLFMQIGAFAVVIILRKRGLIGDELKDMNGLVQRSPGAAILLLIVMLSLAGIPPTIGFMGKWYIFLSLLQTRHYYLAVFAAAYVVPALYYYFRVIVHAFLKDATDGEKQVVTVWQTVALTVCGFVVLGIGIYPEPLLKLAQYSMFLPFARGN